MIHVIFQTAVGKTGQHQLTDFKTDLESAKDCFRKKFAPSPTQIFEEKIIVWKYIFFLLQRFHDKTLNEWEDRDTFMKKAGKYDMLAMDYKATIVSGKIIDMIHDQNTC